jgi:DNA-binding NtrC family response regulator
MNRNIVLIIGDSATEMMPYASSLPGNYEVHYGDCATDGVTNIQQLGGHTISEIIITWDSMSKEHGKALIQKMRTHCPHAAFLIVAGNPALRTMIESLKLVPPNNILSKPFNAGVFRIYVQEVLPRSVPAVTTPRPPKKAPRERELAEAC